MCGIAGIINKEGMDVSGKLIEMLSLIQHRGRDASGIAVYGKGDEIFLRVAISKPDLHELLLNLVTNYAGILSERLYESDGRVRYSEMKLDIDDEAIPVLHRAINGIDGLYTHSLGSGMTVYKENGPVSNLTGRHTIDYTPATHGIAHVRMATESAEDVNAAHPFISPFYSELSLVHNGQFTNYYNVRRRLESKGAQFKTLNDSEVASHLVAYAMMKNGGDLEEALNFALRELDGIFCIIASTSKQLGYVRDKLGIKPLLLLQGGGLTLIGSEQIEFTAIYPDVYADEAEPGEVKVWKI
ncbi:MAG TPA: glutamine amidotransferase [Desulfitobacteriaceae bacterium]|nr:glutamine amidotransferase [Desulfitobacteriaceae bacterium]